MPSYLEHANLNVSKIESATKFLKAAFPEFQVRGQGVANGRPWVHVGTGSTYITLNEPRADEGSSLDPSLGPLNHLGFVVDDVSAVVERLRTAGYREGFIAPSHPHRIRRYFLDADGLEWEFVQYLSDDPAQRNDYSQ